MLRFLNDVSSLDFIPLSLGQYPAAYCVLFFIVIGGDTPQFEVEVYTPHVSTLKGRA